MLALPEYLHGDQMMPMPANLKARLSGTLPSRNFFTVGQASSKVPPRHCAKAASTWMFQLVFGLLLAFLGSLYGLWAQASAVYFESVTMFLFLVLGARRIESVIRRRTMRRREELSLEPPVLAHRLEPEPGTAHHGD